MRINPYLAFNGTCAEAFRFYEKVLGGRIEAMLTHGETPARDHVDTAWHGKIMHAHLRVGDFDLMGGDAPPGMFTKPEGFSVAVHPVDPAEAERIFGALSEGATIKMPIQETFWATRFGMLIDKYGIPWMVNCQQA